jgi:hypothetical protein
MLWVTNASFFSKVYPRFSKLDIYFCPFFKKGLWELKFQYIITLSASAFPFLRCYLYGLVIYLQCGHVTTIMMWNIKHDIFRYFIEDIQNMSQKVDIMFMKNYLPKIGTSFWKPLIANYCAPFRRIYRHV